jgi:hypothetical protein
MKKRPPYALFGFTSLCFLAFSAMPIKAQVEQIVEPSIDEPQSVTVESPKTVLPEEQEGRSVFPDWLDIGITVEGGATYDDNIFISPNNEQEDIIYNLSPIFTIGMGDTEAKTENFLDLNYRADFEFFQDNDDENNIEQRATLNAQYRFTKLVLGFRGYIEDLNGAESEFGDRVSRVISSARVMSLYQWSDRTSFEANGEVINREYDRASNVDSLEYLGELWGNYQIFPKISLGVGITAGVVDVSSGPNQTYYSPNGRMIYAFSEKLSFVLRGGYDIRDFDGQGKSSEAPTFGLVTTWEPFDGTKIELNAYRLVRNSAIISGQNITLTGLVASLEQRLIQKIFLTARLGYEFSDYTSNEIGNPSFREDKYWLARLGASYEPNDWLKVLAFYQFRTNASNVDPVDFDNNQVSLRAQISF